MNISSFPSSRLVNILKIGAFFLFVFLAAVIFYRIIATSIYSMSDNMENASMAKSYATGVENRRELFDKSVNNMPDISLRNIAQEDSVKTADGGTGNSEEMEIKEYTASVETSHLAEDCTKILNLKERSDVVFENATQYQDGCDYYFKVKSGSSQEILALVKGLDPRDLNENTQSIKRHVDDYTSEMEIIEKKIISIESTLSDAVKAYDEISLVATKANDAESLTKIIDNKISVIERLTQQRISANAELDRLKRAKNEQLDRLEYAYFNIHIYQNKFIDGDNLSDSWKSAVRTFVTDINVVLQGLSISLVALLFMIAQYVIYFFIVLIVGKYLWRMAKEIWQK